MKPQHQHQWVGSTEAFVNALNDVQNCYQDELHTEIEKALENQTEVLTRLKEAEKTATSVNSKVSKNIEKSDMTGLYSEINRLETKFRSVEACLNDCLDVIIEIDAALPPRERLIMPGKSNEGHYKHLHDSIRNRKV